MVDFIVEGYFQCYVCCMCCVVCVCCDVLLWGWLEVLGCQLLLVVEVGLYLCVWVDSLVCEWVLIVVVVVVGVEVSVLSDYWMDDFSVVLDDCVGLVLGFVVVFEVCIDEVLWVLCKVWWWEVLVGFVVVIDQNVFGLFLCLGVVMSVVFFVVFECKFVVFLIVFVLLVFGGLFLFNVVSVCQVIFFIVGGVLGLIFYYVVFGFIFVWWVFICEWCGVGLCVQMVMLVLVVLLFFLVLVVGSLFGQLVSGFVLLVGILVIVGVFIFGIGM